MPKLNYFNINLPKTIRHADHSDLSISNVRLSDYKTWKNILHNNTRLSIDVLIPFHNSPHLRSTVESVLKSQIPPQIPLCITIVSSACRQKYLKTADEIVQEKTSKNRTIRHIVQPLPGKPLALNTGISSIKNPIIIQVVDDITLSPDTIGLLYLSLIIHSGFGGAAAVSLPSNLSRKNILMQTQSLHHHYFYFREEYAFVGRCNAFRKTLIPNGFPENTMSEDFWLQLQIQDNTKGFLSIDHAHVNYSKPETWKDYLSQIDRFDKSFKQLEHLYPKAFKSHFLSSQKTFIELIKNPDTDNSNLMHNVTHFILLPNYSLIAKLTYLMICLYQIVYLNIKNNLFPTKSAVFKREISTLN